MKFKKITTIILSAALTLSPASVHLSNQHAATVEAHSGRTDSSGGHKDNKNASGLGSYHYHCGGNPAHLHDGGACPYSSNYPAASATSSDNINSVSNVSTQNNSKDIVLSTGDRIETDSDLIKIIQDVLNQKGYDCGTPDGIAGSKTKNAISDFLSENNDTESTDYMIIEMLSEALDL